MYMKNKEKNKLKNIMYIFHKKRNQENNEDIFI